MAAIQLKKYEPLPNLTVQGNQWQQRAPVQLAPNVAPAQNISVPNNPYMGPGNTWGAAPIRPVLGAPGGGGLNIGHFIGSGLIENAFNAPQSIANTINDAQGGAITPIQAIGQVGTALLNSAGLVAPIGRGASLAFKGGRLLPKVLAGAKIGGVYGGAFGGLSAAGQGGGGKEIAKGTVIGAATGAAGGAALPIAGAGAKGVGKATLKGAKTVRAYDAAQNQVGAVGKNVNKPNVPEVPKGEVYFRGEGKNAEVAAKKTLKGNQFGNGVYMTPNKEWAAKYGDVGQYRVKPGTKFYSAVRDISNEGVGTLYDKKTGVPIEFGHLPGIGKYLDKYGSGEENQALQEWARANGYHGLKIHDTSKGDALNEVVVFDKNRIEPVTQPTQGAKVAAKPKVTAKLTAEQKAELPPSEQMKLAKLEGLGPTPKAPIAENIDKNPYKANVREVQAGDYKGARLAPGQLSHPIRFIADRFDSSISRLAKKSPDEYTNFWRLLENPSYKGSKEFEQAKGWFREGSNAGHGSAVALGHNTNYIKDYALHPWELTDSSGAQLVGGPGILGKHSQGRIHRTVAEGEASGLHLGTDPRTEGLNYLRGTANAVDKMAFKKAAIEADAHILEKTRTMDLGHGHAVQLSDEGYKKLKAFEYHQPSSNKAVRGLRTANQAAKSTVLSASQFHTVNIGALRAGPAIALKGHPVAAVKGVARMFRGLTPGGRAAAERVLGQAYKDGMVHKAAEIGMPYGARGYETAGTKLKSGVGHRLVFETQMPMMHDQVVRSITHDLEKKNIPLNSRTARDVGVVGNATMGFINKQALNISPRVRQGMSDLMLAGQFTPSKVVTVGKITKKGVAGDYARADVAANTAAALALVAGVGYLMGQQSDNARDLLLRALVNPAAPTSSKDAKGNNIELRTPLTYTAEISKLLGIKLNRGSDGHLHATWQANKLLSKENPALDWMRSRLSPGASTAVKLATNTSFANKPLFDPNAPAGTKAGQAATSIIQGSLPIGVQGLAFTGAVKKHLPGTSQEILNANTPGSNAVLKSGLSSLGFTPRTDQTVGKAKDTAAYFDAVDSAGKGLDRQSKDAYDLWTGSKKNPVTGKYDVQPSYNDARAKASALLQSPKALDALYSLNQSLAKKGQAVDPLWSQSKDNVVKYMQYQNMPPGSSDKSVWYDNNKSWYQPLSDARGKFFTSLPAGDPNKPKLDLQYPEASPSVQSAMDQYSAITDSKAKGDYLDAHPEVIKQWTAQSNYTNEVRKKLGYTPLKNYPEPTDSLQSFMDTYNGASKSQRKLIRNSDPNSYQKMISYFDSVDLYNINKQGGKSQLQGQPDYTSKQAGAISSLAKDIYKNPDGTYSVVPAGWMSGASNSSGSSGGSSGSSSSYRSRSARYNSLNPRKYAVSLKAGGSAPKPHVSVSTPKTPKAKYKVSKPKVTLKKTS